ncbi:hypothetical protein [Paraburkholderia nodosa]|uniref:hypothetical protein n=1 Tax=Paraburkholderia nodosa TaxID=392320 RepID=UPI0012B684C1|nr:hypothetical protein [Paraburkholderia nodosa]
MHRRSGGNPDKPRLYGLFGRLEQRRDSLPQGTIQIAAKLTENNLQQYDYF